MDDEFKIYIEQLREGSERKFEESLDPVFLDIHERDLVFNKPIGVEGVAYLAEDELVIHWDIETEARIPCRICNELAAVPIQINNFYHSEPLSEIKTGVYNSKELLRETVLLEVPTYAECHEGRCPKRKEVDKYLKESSDQEEGYRPFADLDWKE